MNENTFNFWFRKYSGLPFESADRVKMVFRKVPNIDGILVQAIREHLTAEGIKPFIVSSGSEKPEAQVENVRPTQRAVPLPGSIGTTQAKPPQSGRFAGIKKLAARFKKTKAPKVAQVEDEGETAPKRRFPISKKMLIGIGSGVLILVVVAVAVFSLNRSSFPRDTAFDVPTSSSRFADQGDGGPVDEETKPVLENPNPLNFQHSDWLKPLQFMILAEAFGILIALFGDAFFRKQWTDAVVAVTIAMVTIFLTVPATVPIYFAIAWFLILLAFVCAVSFLGGRDFTPLVGYFLLVGVIGGLIFTKISAVQGMTHIASAPVLPMTQLAVVFQLMDWKSLAFPLVVFAYIILGTTFAFLEALRPSEDKTPRWGSVIAAGIGLAAFFLLLHFAHLAPWLSYVVAFSVSIAISALSQNERAMRLITDRWGVRSSFDGAMLITAVLLVIHFFLGVVG